MKPRILTPAELRANPALLGELRSNPGAHVERRFAPLTGVEVRASDGDGEGYKAHGLAAVFDSRSKNLGGFVEEIKPGAFRKALKDGADEARFLFNHDPNLVLASAVNGTLRMKETPKGLAFDADVAPTTYAADLRVLLDRGDIHEASFAFRVARGGDSWDEDPETGALVRTINEFESILDVSSVTYPAYPAATSGLRSEIEGGDAEALTVLAWRLHRGEMDASEEDRAALDAALVQFSTVSPWVAERTFRAVASEPELLAAIPDKRVKVEIEDAPGASDFDPVAAAARSRTLALLEG